MEMLTFKDFIARIEFQKQVIDIKRQLYYSNSKIKEKVILEKLFNMNRKSRIEMGYKYKDFNNFYIQYRNYKRRIKNRLKQK